MDSKQKKYLPVVLVIGNLALTICLIVIFSLFYEYLQQAHHWTDFRIFNVKSIFIFPFVLPFLFGGILVGFYIDSWKEGIKYFFFQCASYLWLFVLFLYRLFAYPNRCGGLQKFWFILAAAGLYILTYSIIWLIRCRSLALES